MNVNGREVVLWDCNEDAEELRHRTLDAAVEAHLDRSEQRDGTLTVYGYARMVAPVPDAGLLLEDLCEGLWSGLGSPDDGCDITEEMLAETQAFCVKIAGMFNPFACEVVHTEQVDVAAWIEEHKP